MPPEENRATALRILEEVFNKGNTSILLDLTAPDAVLYLAGYPEPFRGNEAAKRWADEYVRAFDVRLTVQGSVAEGEDVVVRWTNVATHRAEYAGIPRTGRQVTFTSVEWFHFENGRVVAVWNLFDALDVVQQLGALPRGRPPKALLRLITWLRGLRDR